MAQTTYSGSSEKESYSSVVLMSAGSYFDHIKNDVISCMADLVDVRVKEGCHLLTVADFGTADGVFFSCLLEEVFLGTFQSKTTRQRDVFFAAIGKSMYDQCLPNQSLDVAVSANALHWLSEKPCTIENGLTFHGGSKSERKMFQDRAHKDWFNFLLSRGRELKKGGTIFALLPNDEDGFVRKVHTSLDDAWRRMFSLGKITETEFRTTVIFTYVSRTKAEFALPFKQADIFELGIRLVSVHKRMHNLAPLLKLKNSNNKPKYTRAAVLYVKAWTRNSIYHGLSDERTADEKRRLVDDFYEIMYDVFSETDIDVTKLALTEVVVKKDV